MAPRYANRLLIVEDEQAIRFAIRSFMEANGFVVDEAGDCREAEQGFRTARPDVVVIDYLLPDGNALELLPRLRAIDPNVPLLVLTAHGSIDLAVRAIKEGAEQFLTKPVELKALHVIVDRVLENQRSRRKEVAQRSQRSRGAADPFLGAHPAIRQLEADARLVLPSDSPVLIHGETGTGKGVLARWLHENGPRADEPFVDLNCAGLSKEFLDTELFGHEKGAFTGAVAVKQGLLEIAHRGTAFLDEVGDMDPDVQPKLLKVVEERRFRRLGDVRDRGVDVRLIAATHQDLQARMREGRFRQDLYFRISTIPLRIPALRERPDDVPAIAARLLERIGVETGKPDLELSPEAERAVRAYAWPGNIRELRNVLERAALLARGASIGLAELRFDAVSAGAVAGGAGAEAAWNTRLSLEELERQHIAKVITEEGGHVGRAASRLQIPRSSLYQKLKRYRLDASSNETGRP